MDALVRAYADGAPARDPEFVRTRAAHYDPRGKWIRTRESTAGSPVFTIAERKVGPLHVRTLESAFGADVRPFTEPLEDGSRATEDLLRAVLAIPRWDLGEIVALHDAELELIQAALAVRRRSFVTFPLPIRVIPGGQSYETYRKSRGPSVNKNQRAHLHRAERSGLTFRTSLTWDDVLTVLAARQGHFAAEDYSKATQFRQFLRTLRERVAAAGRLLEVGVFDGARPIAYQIAFRTGRVLHMYQTAFDPAYTARRPGALALEKTIALGLEHDVALIDLMNDTPHLASFTPIVLPLHRLVFFSNSLTGRLVAFGFRARRAKAAFGQGDLPNR